MHRFSMLQNKVFAEQGVFLSRDVKVRNTEEKISRYVANVETNIYRSPLYNLYRTNATTSRHDDCKVKEKKR